MSQCKICGQQCPDGRTFCDVHLNDWEAMLGALKMRQAERDGEEAVAGILTLQMREMQIARSTWNQNPLALDAMAAEWYL